MFVNLKWLYLLCFLPYGRTANEIKSYINDVLEGPKKLSPSSRAISLRAADSTNLKCHMDQWATVYPACGGKSQSPINIITKTLKTSGSYSKFTWKNYNTYPTKATIKNADNYTMKYSAIYKSGEVPTITGGVLGDNVYEFVEWHCHWSDDNDFGSEHTFNGLYYPMECHFVHYNKKYGNINSALAYADGVAVLGYVYLLRFVSTFPADTLAPAIVRLRESDHVDIDPLPLNVYAPEFNSNYVNYKGSLTTPPCSEAVNWIVNTQAQKISRTLMKRFRFLARHTACMTDNFRPTQSLNGRQVTLVKTGLGAFFSLG